MWPRQEQAGSPPLAPAEAWLRLAPEGAARYDRGSGARRRGLISGISPPLWGGGGIEQHHLFVFYYFLAD